MLNWSPMHLKCFLLHVTISLSTKITYFCMTLQFHTRKFTEDKSKKVTHYIRLKERFPYPPTPLTVSILYIYLCLFITIPGWSS